MIYSGTGTIDANHEGIAMEAKRTQNRRVLRGALVVVVVAGALWIALPGGRDLLLGIAMWSLVAIPPVAAGIYFARHDWGVGRFFGDGDPYDGHGPD